MNWQTDLLEVFKTFLPKYLTPKLQEDLLKFIAEDFPHSDDPFKVYSEIQEKGFFLQGDGIEDVPFSNFKPEISGFEADFGKGVMISNTCDVADENVRMLPPFAALSRVQALDEYLNQLRSDGISNARIESFERNLKQNKLSSFMYLPAKTKAGTVVFPESFVRFDRIANIPSEILNKSYSPLYAPQGDRLFSFSDYGFFLFITKLSVHFCRFRENVMRSGF